MGVFGDQTVSFAIHGPISRDDLPGLCDRVCTFLGGRADTVVLCHVEGVEPDAVTVDALARLQLAARRQRCEIRLCNCSDELCQLVAFMGLSQVFPA